MVRSEDGRQNEVEGLRAKSSPAMHVCYVWDVHEPTDARDFFDERPAPTYPGFVPEELYAYIAGIINAEKGQSIAIGGTADHIHILANFPHAKSLSEMLRRIKGNSSHWINAETKTPDEFQWQIGYGAFAVSMSQRKSVIEYIQTQEEHHRKRTFQEEFLGFLARHEISYDPRHIWN